MLATMGRAPVLRQVNIVVGDMDAAAAFYQRLGLRLRPTPPTWAPHHRNADTEGGIDIDLDSVAFARVWGDVDGGVVLTFSVEADGDVDRLYAELTAAGHAGLRPPYDAFWGARYAVVADPAGNPIGLAGPFDAAKQAAPPNPPGSPG